jgi:uncharacterized coiled-coil DUF342 family protein
MSTHKPPSIEERLQRIQEALEQMPDLSDLELMSDDLAFKIEEGHEDVARLRDEVAEVKDKVDDLESEDR